MDMGEVTLVKPDRTCGSCNECCVVAAVSDLDKPAFTPCQYLWSAEDGCCSIAFSPERPGICNVFECSWLKGIGDLGYDRPDECGAMFALVGTQWGPFGMAVETKPDSILTSARLMALAWVDEHEVPLIVNEYQKYTDGEWVIVKDSLKERARLIIGAEVARLAPDVAMYERKEP